MKKERILYTYTSRSSFVRNDIDILGRKHEISEYKFNTSSKFLVPWELVKQLFFLLFRVNRTQYFITMFGGYHSFLPALFSRLTGKPSIVIAGGTDCVAFPSIGYGNFSKKLLGKFTRWSFKLSSHIAPVHESLVITDYTYQDKDYPKQGFKYHCPGLDTPYSVISYGFDPEKWFIPGKKKLANSFITVAAGLENPYRAVLKGVDLVIEAAAEFPQATFTIIGCPDWYKLPVRSDNIRLYSFVSNEELRELYNQHEFYVQVSMSEGFPNAICEAMLCRCIPIGSNVGGIPDIIGDTGFILPKRSSTEFKSLLADAMSVDKETYGNRAQNRIRQNYPKDIREKQLLALLSKLMLAKRR